MTASEPDLPIAELVRAFEDTTLPKSRWTHASHLRVALHYVLAHGEDEAVTRMRANIKRYIAAVGVAPTAYHETITVAWTKVIARFAEARAGCAHDDLARELVASCDKKYLLRFYDEDRLMSDEARAGWLAPNRAFTS